MDPKVSDYVSRNRMALGASLALSLMLLQFGVISASPGGLAVRIVLPATIALAPLALWPLRQHLGVWVVFVGLTANFATILANGGLMPIERSTVVEAVGAERAATHASGQWIAGSKDVLVADAEGQLTALGDSIIVRVGGSGFAASPGDIVVWCGLVLLAGEASWRWQRGLRGTREGAPSRVQRAEGSAPTPQ
ncbi:MAG: DUF5317 family protein [Dehalococcoidia bacterium]